MSYYHNLIEDEGEARRERIWTRVAISVIFFGIVLFWVNYKKKNS